MAVVPSPAAAAVSAVAAALETATTATLVATAAATPSSSTTVHNPLALPACDYLALLMVFQLSYIIVFSTTCLVLFHYRALHLYDRQEPNISLAPAASAAQKQKRWWKRKQGGGPKGWWLANLGHKLHVVFVFIIFLTLLTILVDAKAPAIPVWLIRHLPDLFIMLQPFLRFRLTEVPIERRFCGQMFSFHLRLPHSRQFVAVDDLTEGSPDGCVMTVSRPASNPDFVPTHFAPMKASQLDRAESLGRVTANAIFLAPFVWLILKVRSTTEPPALGGWVGSGLIAIAVPLGLIKLPRAAANIPVTVRGKASLSSQCAPPYALAVIIVISLFLTERVSVPNLPKETAETLLDVINFSLPLFAVYSAAAFSSLIGMLARIEAKRLNLDRATEAQIEAHLKRIAEAESNMLPTDVHGRRPVALGEARLTKEEERQWRWRTPVAFFTGCLSIIVNVLLLVYLLMLDDFPDRLEVAPRTSEDASISP
ncbi:hypothetical protein U1Q18_044719 [Sarracenia purpurea var. burkii]